MLFDLHMSGLEKEKHIQNKVQNQNNKNENVFFLFIYLFIFIKDSSNKMFFLKNAKKCFIFCVHILKVSGVQSCC